MSQIRRLDVPEGRANLRSVIMLGNVVRSLGDRGTCRVVSILARTGIPPATWPLCEVLAAAASAAAFALRMLPLAVGLFIAHGFFDYLDGATRRRGLSDPPEDGARAERIHALADKLSETMIFLGMAFGQFAPWTLAMAAMATSLAATWTGFVAVRTAGVPRSRSLFDRTDRMLLLLFSLLVCQAVAGLSGVVAMNCITIGQRLALVFSSVTGKEGADERA